MEGEKTRSGKRRVWRKLHLAMDADTHEVICADLSLNNVTDAEAFSGLIRQTHRKIRVASADGAYDTKQCHHELRRKKRKALIPPRTRAAYWPAEYAYRNQAVARQRLTGSNAWWKWNTDYNRRSVAETAMYRVKQLFGGYLTLRDRDFIHVMDLAAGHLAAIKNRNYHKNFCIYNLDTGNGYSVLDLIHTFQRVTGVNVNYKLCERRPGDIAECWSDPSLAEMELNWKAQRTLEEMMADVWRWEKNNKKAVQNYCCTTVIHFAKMASYTTHSAPS